jgi:hypothetical protein
MIPDAHAFARVRIPMLLISAAAWGLLLLSLDEMYFDV